MARKRKEDAEKTRARILASALSLFARKGYEHTTFNDIAARLKLTKGAVYWHFSSKEALIAELVKNALARFQAELKEQMPAGELTFPAVTEMMVANAEALVKSPRGTAFFKLMKCQIRWGDASMDAVRDDLLSNRQFGPKQALRTALENDLRSGRVREANVEEIATVVIAIWDGLVQAKIDHFLQCDLASTLRHSYAAIWRNIRASGAD